ncbi:hypothetical protein RJ639_011369, partial [Escallonia herrerae]
GDNIKSRTIIIIATTTASAVLIAILICLFLRLRKRKQQNNVESLEVLARRNGFEYNHPVLRTDSDASTLGPTMALVVLMLNSFSITLALPSEPAFFMHSSIDPELPLLRKYSSGAKDSGQSTNKSAHFSENEASISELHPRYRNNRQTRNRNVEQPNIIENENPPDLLTLLAAQQAQLTQLLAN